MQIYLLHHKMTKKVPFESHLKKLCQSLQESLLAFYSQKQFTVMYNKVPSIIYDVLTKQFCCIVYDRGLHLLL